MLFGFTYFGEDYVNLLMLEFWLLFCDLLFWGLLVCGYCLICRLLTLRWWFILIDLRVLYVAC